MRVLPIYQIDAFTGAVFAGNPAALCPLEAWLDDETLQAIAAENNLAETAYLVGDGDEYELRWFTPTTEVELCGHATLAAGHLVLRVLRACDGPVRFHTRSGELSVATDADRLTMDLPSIPATPCDAPAALVDGLGAEPAEVHEASNYLAVFPSEADVRALAPDFRVLAACHPRGVIATAAGDETDFVSRFFAPSFGVDEDPVTGSAHCTLTPYWANRLGKPRLRARQISRRGGELDCEDLGARTRLAGRCALYLQGTINVP